MKTTRYLLTLVLAVSCIGFSATAQLSKAMGGLMTKKESDLSKMVLTVGYTTNLYSPELKTMTANFMKDKWVEGSSQVGVVLTKSDGFGLIKLDGTVTIDGVPVEYVGLGSYVMTYPKDDGKPKTIEIKSSNGQSYTVKVAPLPQVSVKSINGQGAGTTINLEEDMKLELEIPANVQGRTFNLSMVAGMPGGKEFTNFLVAKVEPSITVPAGAFKSKHVAGGAGEKNVVKFKKNNHLRLEYAEQTVIKDSPFGAAQTLVAAWHTLPVELDGKDDSKLALTEKGKTDKKAGDMEFYIRKENSFYAPALKNIDKMAVASLSVSGVLYKEETTKSSYTSGNTRYTSISTTSWQFPQLPNAFWDQLLEGVYQDLTGHLASAYGMEFVDVEKVVSHPEYASFYTDQDENTTTKIQRNYKGTKRLMPTRLTEVFGDAATTFAADRPETKLMDEIGVDALLLVSLDLRVNDDGKKKIVLDPVLTFKVLGHYPIYGLGSPPVVMQGTIVGRGVPFEKSQFNDLDALATIAQREALLTAFREAVKVIEDRAQEDDYSRIWDLQ